MGKRREANRMDEEFKRILLEEMPYCGCGAPTTAFHHIRTGAGVKDHSKSNLQACCDRCHRVKHNCGKWPWEGGK